MLQRNGLGGDAAQFSTILNFINFSLKFIGSIIQSEFPEKFWELLEPIFAGLFDPLPEVILQNV